MKNGPAIIVIETSQRIATAAIVAGDGSIISATASAGAPASETLADLLAELIGTSVIAEVVVSDGPGSATGIRIGIAFGTGLAAGYGARLTRVSLFEAMSAGREDGPAAILAGGGKVVWGRSAESAVECDIEEFRGAAADGERILISADLAARLGEAVGSSLVVDGNGALTIARYLGDQ